MTSNRDLTVLSSFHFYYHNSPSNQRNHLREDYYTQYNPDTVRILPWQQLKERCNDYVKALNHKYPENYLYERYIAYLRARKELSVIFNDVEYQENVLEALEKNNQSSSDIAKLLSRAFGNLQIAGKTENTVFNHVLSSINPEDNLSAPDMIAHLVQHDLGNSTLHTLISALDYQSTSGHYKIHPIDDIFVPPIESLESYELSKLLRSYINPLAKTMYHRGYIFGIVYGAYKFGHYIHRMLAKPEINASKKMLARLNKSVKNGRIIISGQHSDEIIHTKKQRPSERNKRHRKNNYSGSITRLLHEVKKMRRFIDSIHADGLIDQAKYNEVLGELRPARQSLHDHFRIRLNERFRISTRQIQAIQDRADRLPVYGYVSSGAVVKRVRLNKTDVYVIMTDDSEGRLTLTTAYTHKMFLESKGIVASDMTEKERELYERD